MKKRIGLFWIGAFIILLSAGCGSSKTVYLETEHTEEDAAVTESPAAEAVYGETERGICYVYVCGAVNASGVYALPAGSRIYEAVAAAGGLSEDASKECINQAMTVSDGQMIKVLTTEEAKEVSTQEASAQAEDAAANDGRINLNTAGADELMTLPGIGQSKADSIINYRRENGGFDKIEDIMNITGIKEGVFNKIKEDITVD